MLLFPGFSNDSLDINPVHEPQQVALEFNRAMAWLEREGRALHQPEVGLEEGRVEVVHYAAAAEHVHRFDREAFEREDVFLVSQNSGFSIR